MSSAQSTLWITESDVVSLMHLGQAIDALERGLLQEASGEARNMSKTHVAWGNGHTLHALGASFEGAGIVGTKSWAHTEHGATPLLTLWDSRTGRLRAIIEAFALGQMRTGATSGVATKWMARPDADTMALIGTGKQALTQVAALAAVRTLREVRVFSPTAEHRNAFTRDLVGRGFGFGVVEATSIADAVRGSSIVTLATRARTPFLDKSMLEPGTHVNAIGAITPERQEFAPDVFERAGLVAVDDPQAVQRLSREFMDYFGRPNASWNTVKPLSALVAAKAARSSTCDVSLFKAMGMGISDLALGIEVLDRALATGRGRPLDHPARVWPRLSAQPHLSQE